MADEIIDFYKKAKEPEEPQKPIEEQKETPVPEIPKPDEPFDRFLLELAEKLQKEKVITEKQQETFVEQIKEPVSTDPNENDPFKKFIGSFANIIKQDELVNREENIKEATISFINKLKEQPDEPFIIKDENIVKPKQKKYLPPKIAKKVQKLPQPVKKEEPVVEEQADEPVKEEPKDENSYVKELKTADKSNKKIPEKIKSVSDIKSIVEKQVAEILSRYPNLGFTGGGGGTNAVQYAKGGTMDGDLNVTGKFLSGGVDISTLFGSGGGAVSGIPDRLISGPQSLILNTDGSISFPDGFITAPDGQILNIQSETVSPSSFARISLSPYAFFAYDNEGNSISFDVVDNAIVLTSKDQYEWTFNQQGVLVGPNSYLTVNALSSLGRILSGGKDLLEIFALSGTGGGGGGTGREDVNTIVISNSANWNTAYNVATAYQSVSSSFATNSTVNSISSLLTPLALTNSLTGQLVTNTAFANYQTGVAGSTATLLPTSIYQNASGNWQATYTNLVTNSAAYLSGVNLTFLQEPSANWNSTYTTVQTNSSNWQDAYNTATVYQSNSSSYATTAYADATYLPLSGGTLTGNLSVYGSTFINNNLTIGGSLTALGTATFANTIFTTTSALSVYNTGPGPALYVYQASGPYDVASFYDGDGIEVLHVGNAGPGGFGKVGVNESFPNEELTVRGSISATEVVYAENGSSTNWNTAYQHVSSQSLNTTDNVQFNQVNTPLIVMGAGDFTINETSLFWGGNIIFSVEDSSFWSGGNLAFLAGGEWYVPISFGGGNAATNIAQTRTNLGLGSADNVEFNQVNANVYLSGGVNLFNLLSSSGGGGGFTTDKKFDYVTIANIDYSYSGTAVQGTIEASPTWKLIRLTYNNNGTISNSASAINSWTGRLTATYV